MQRWWGGPALFALYTAASVSGLLLIKSWLPVAAAGWRAGRYLGEGGLVVAVGAALYVGSFLLWLLILSRYELTLAYPVAIGLTLIFSSLGAVMLLGEAMSTTRALGIAIIFAGIALVAR